MSVEALRDLVGRLVVSTNALSALGAAIEARTSGIEVAPALRAHLDDVLLALGARDALDGLGPAAARPLLGEIRVALLHSAGRVSRSGSAQGWQHSGVESLQAAGEVSAGFPALLQRLIPHLAGLDHRLASSDARFLDVGVGVGVLSIELARLWPTLRVVGIDVWAPSLALARENLARAGLGDRVELREQGVQALPDVAAFDLAWIPSAFIPGADIPEALRRVRRALRPGGWLLFAAANTGGDPLASAVARLRTVEWGAHPFSPDEALDLLAQAGFVETVKLPGPASAAAAFLAGRAPV